MVIQAIETRLNGWFFRSRLEARYSLFLEKLDLDFEYELDGYCPEVGGYLPDFFVPAMMVVGRPEIKGLFLEVKPPIVDVPDKDVNKWMAFTKETGAHLLSCFGSPWEDAKFILTSYAGDEKYHVDRGRLVDDGENIYFMPFRIIGEQADLLSWEIIRYVFSGDDPLSPWVTDRLKEATWAARSARFEHGADHD